MEVFAQRARQPAVVHRTRFIWSNMSIAWHGLRRVARPSSTGRRRARVGSIVVSGFLAASLAAQTPEPTGQPVFRTEANFVRVDIYPTLDGVVVADLERHEFEVLEDGVPQPIETFEFVNLAGGVTPGLTSTSTREPSTVAESRAVLADARARVIVVFLDTYHVSDESSHDLGPTLADALARELGPDDLVAVMTPDMRPEDVTFGPSTESLERFLRERRNWGRRGELVLGDLDPDEQAYRVCYPPDERDNPAAGTSMSSNVSEVAWEMIQRRRERLTLEAFDGLVAYLGPLREERKAVLAISEGWTLFRANQRLARPIGGRTPGRPGVTIGPGGRLGSTADRGSDDPSRYTCDADRMDLASADHQRDFRSLLDRANRGNVSFYVVDPRGLATHDSTLTEPLASPSADRTRLGQRQSNLRVLAEATDGIALVDRGDLERQLPRVFGDLTQYYLLGYYSTNPRLDGSYRRIEVRVSRPGIEIRARRGYRAPTREEVEIATASAVVPDAPSPEAASLAEALGRLARLDRRPEELILRSSAIWSPVIGPAVSVVGELGGRLSGSTAWRAGASASIRLVDRTGRSLATSSTSIPPRGSGFSAVLRPEADLSGSLSVEVRLTPADDTAEPIVDAVSLDWPDDVGAVVLGDPVYHRARAAAAAAFVPTADPRFRRTERVRIDMPVVDDVVVAAAVIDRQGNDLGLPIDTGVTVTDGQAWAGAEVRLAPLAPGDYVLSIESSSAGLGASERRLVEFRVVP